MQGKIIKGIAGFYYVHIAGKGVYECKAKGIFRKNKIKPLVGDDVVIDILDEEKREGKTVVQTNTLGCHGRTDVIEYPSHQVT